MFQEDRRRRKSEAYTYTMKRETLAILGGPSSSRESLPVETFKPNNLATT